MPPTLVDSRRWGGGLSVVWSGWWRPASSPVCQSLEPARCFFCIEETCVSPSYYFSTRISSRGLKFTPREFIPAALLSLARGGEGRENSPRIRSRDLLPEDSGGEDISGALVKCVFLERILKKGKIFFNTWWSVSSFGNDKFLESIFMDLFFFFFISLCVMYNRRMRAGRRIIFVMSSRWWIVLSNYLSIECLGKQVCYRRR